MRKRIAVIGGGFTGLSCGVSLVDEDFEVVIFEASDKCGGLASGFNPSTGSGQVHWKWNLESFYHHIFTGDREIIELAKKVGAKYFFKEPQTTSFFRHKETVLDSPLSLMKFSAISFPARLRMGFGLAILKLIPDGIFLERYRVVDLLPKLIGSEGYKHIWEKLLKAKFGPYENLVNMAWFWARVAKRSKRLGYFEGGFQGLVDKTAKYITSHGGIIRLNTRVTSLQKNKRGVSVNGEDYDAVVLTIPASTIKKIVPGVDFPELNYLWGQTLVLETTGKLIKGYWMNILEENWPFLVTVEHTNFVDKKNYTDKHIIYVGNYLPDGHKQLKMTEQQLLRLYMPYLKKINGRFNKDMIINAYLFRVPYAQPVFPINYSRVIPKMRTKTKGIYLANMSMVYPFDRGTNYAVKMGRDVARIIKDDLRQ